MTDFVLTTFSSKGKVLQIEYALNVVAKGKTAIGIKAKNGIVLVVEKKQSSILVEESSVHKIVLLTDNIAAKYAGLGPDFRILSQQARKLIKKYDLKYQEEIFVRWKLKMLSIQLY